MITQLTDDFRVRRLNILYGTIVLTVALGTCNCFGLQAFLFHPGLLPVISSLSHQVLIPYLGFMASIVTCFVRAAGFTVSLQQFQVSAFKYVTQLHLYEDSLTRIVKLIS